ncbi:MAG: malto-oligosyltrehalose trehalohydrolase [Planctomycetes bacterium]|nr:malto-oligosyltrehalose trehalohydrolase [Planctomycetota bacterium]
MVDSPGARYLGNETCRFEVWAPFAKKVEVHLLGPDERFVALAPAERGYHAARIDGVTPGCRYFFRLDGQKERPDPASRFQPDGVHGPSQVTDTDFNWRDAHWFGLPLDRYVCYELHVGTFTPEGTFDAVIGRLDDLRELGVTAVNIMPVAQFPGSRNWGYDGVYLYAVQNSYGGTQGLKRLVDECHARGLAVILDVVYNHLGPEGNYLGEFAPYFTDRYKTPWGSALNFDGPDSDEVRRFFLGTALQWQTEFHIDALRLDAVHAILDHSAFPFLQELAEVTSRRALQLNRRFHLISESSLNDVIVLQPTEIGGWGHDALWNDDFHHAVHTLLTGEHNGYYEDFGRIEHLARAWRDGFTYSGQYSPFRRRRYGNSARCRPARQFVICAQNHDQIGNRMAGERLSGLIDFEGLKLAATLVILSPYVPLLFMGEEYGETAPFQFFVSHGDAQLIENVRKGRREEFAEFGWQGEVPDPQDQGTFERCRLDHHLKDEGRHKVLRDFYRDLLALRRDVPALAQLSKDHQKVIGFEREKSLFVRRWHEQDEVVLVFNFAEQEVRLELPIPAGDWQLLVDSAARRWQGPGEALAILQSHGWSHVACPRRSALAFRRRDA